MSEQVTDKDDDMGGADQSDVARLVLAMEPHLGGAEVEVVCAAMATLLAAAFGQKARSAKEHALLCDWLLAGLKEDRLSRYGPQASTRVQ